MNTPKATDRTAGGMQFVTFCLGNESYGIPVGKVREIIRPIEAFAVPGMEGPVEGVINLRGEIIPVVRVHGVLGVKRNEEADERRRRIIILDTDKGGIGIVVDEVMEVVKVSVDQIQKAPSMYSRESEREAVIGIVQISGRMIICIEPSRLLAGGIDVKEFADC